MKNILFTFVAISLLASCSSPVLKWIDVPVSGNTAEKEILSFSFDTDG